MPHMVAQAFLAVLIHLAKLSTAKRAIEWLYKLTGRADLTKPRCSAFAVLFDTLAGSMKIFVDTQCKI